MILKDYVKKSKLYSLLCGNKYPLFLDSVFENWVIGEEEKEVPKKKIDF